jgi:hypothetical protein
MHRQDSNMGQDAHSARAPTYQLLAGPSFSTPRYERHHGAAIEPVSGLAFELLGLDGP